MFLARAETAQSLIVRWHSRIMRTHTSDLRTVRKIKAVPELCASNFQCHICVCLPNAYELLCFFSLALCVCVSYFIICCFSFVMGTHVFCTNLCNGKSYLVSIMLKSDFCNCGCRGNCTLYEIQSAIAHFCAAWAHGVSQSDMLSPHLHTTGMDTLCNSPSLYTHDVEICFS